MLIGLVTGEEEEEEEGEGKSHSKVGTRWVRQKRDRGGGQTDRQTEELGILVVGWNTLAEVCAAILLAWLLRIVIKL